MPAALAGAPDPVPELSVEQIIEKNVAARGGLEAWRRVQTMVWVGHIEAGDSAAAHLPFVLEMKRPNKTRFAINTPQLISVRIFDGQHGWKVRAASGDPPDLQPYAADEITYARDGQGLDGALMGYQAKGVGVALEGVEQIEGNKAYRLRVNLPSGASQQVWIDAQSFLDIKSDRQSHNAAGMTRTVSMHYRDYRTIDGLQLPFLIENSAGAGKAADKMVIDKILINFPLEDRMFNRPNVPQRPARPSSTTQRRPSAGDAGRPQS